MEVLLGPTRLVALRGDITRQEVDAIVNAANPGLMGGGGVDGAIHRAGGPAILEECRRIVAERGPLPTGRAVITTGGFLPARHVIHTVGPVWRGGAAGEDELLRRAYENCLALALDHGLGTIAFPAISTGAYGFPKRRASRIALAAVSAFLRKKPFQEVRFVLFSGNDLVLYTEGLAALPTDGFRSRPGGS
ncbi:MAG: O-acetyl-ADP-ribose deacetylase [Bacillota bacterium]|nr:O-acetyl-ADP-ribose deacetylase [Bacillota bacterium]